MCVSVSVSSVRPRCVCVCCVLYVCVYDWAERIAVVLFVALVFVLWSFYGVFAGFLMGTHSVKLELFGQMSNFPLIDYYVQEHCKVHDRVTEYLG